MVSYNDVYNKPLDTIVFDHKSATDFSWRLS